MVQALEQAWDDRGTADRVKLRESVQQYEISQVSENHMKPAVDALLERVRR